VSDQCVVAMISTVKMNRVLGEEGAAAEETVEHGTHNTAP
jgi:hypothetical protein